MYSSLHCLSKTNGRTACRYKRVVIKTASSGIKFEEFDFSFYNKTPFCGLENDIANCYCNPLLQAREVMPCPRQYRGF